MFRNHPNLLKKNLPALIFLVLLATALWLVLRPTAVAAPASAFLLLDGRVRHTHDFQGKVTLVNFWATSCTSCVAEMPALAATHEKFKSRGYDTVAVAMSYDRPEYVQHFAQSRQLPFDVAFDRDGSIARDWADVRATPTSFLLDSEGRIVRRYVGPPDMVRLHASIEKLLPSPD